MKSIAAIVVAVALAGAALAVAIHYKHKREDAVAAYAFSAITAKREMCVKSAFESRAERFNDCKKKYSRLSDDSCRVMAEASVAYDPIASCNDQQEAALREWKRLYPRQAAEEQQRQDERQRQRDEKRMQERKPR